MSKQKLMRSSKEKMFAGILGGVADYLGWDVTILRIVYVLGTVFTSIFPGVIIYIVLWLLMPEELES